MLTLRVLGGLELRDAAGAEAGAVLRQPKRLALLVYLTLAGPGRFHRRDALLGLFWPELDQDHARAALRRALYFLRRELGEQVIRNRGDDEVGIELEAIRCDASIFDEKLEAGELAQALGQYRGDLLESFYVAGAPAVEEWLDRERSRLRERAGAAALALAERPDAPAGDAERWARMAHELLPHSEEAVGRLLALLAARGDRIGVRRVWQAFTARLREDLDLVPSLALSRRAERIMAGARTGDARPRPVPPPGEPAAVQVDADLVLILPFTVRGDGALAYLGDGMVDLLGTKLDGAGVYRVVEAHTALAAARELGSPPDPDRAAASATRLGAGLVLLGTLAEAGGVIEVIATLYDSAGKAKHRVERRAEGEGRLFALIDELARDLLVPEDPLAAERLARLAALTTESLPALKSWLAGERAFRSASYLDAAAAFGRAAGIDPGFAAAHYRLAASLTASAFIETARQASAKAFESRDRLGPHGRMLVEAQHAWLRGASAEAERRYAAIVSALPESQEAWFLLGDVQIHSNPYRGRSIALARPAFERAAELDPGHLASLLQLVRLAALERRTADLERLVTRARGLYPDPDIAVGLRALLAFALGSEAERASVGDELSRASGVAIGRAFTDVALYGGDLSAAERLGARLFGAARSEEFRALGHLILAHLALAGGRLVEALDRVREAEPHEPSWALQVRGLFCSLPFVPVDAGLRAEAREALIRWNPDSARPSFAIPLAFHNEVPAHLRQFLIGLLSLRLDDPASAQEAAEALEELPVTPFVAPAVTHLVRTLHADRLRSGGAPADALALLEMPSADVWFQLSVASPFFAGTYERFLRAELLAEAGRLVEAHGWWECIAERSPFELPFLAPARLRQAELWRGLGDPERAVRSEARARELWGAGPSW